MTQGVSDSSIPQEPKKSTFAKWFDRFVCFIGFSKPKVIKTAKQVEIAKQRVDEQRALTGASEKLQKNFAENEKALLKLKSESLPFWKVTDGRLKKTESPQNEEMQNEVIQLASQTYRQAWGKLIEAHHGLKIKEVELQKLNDLLGYLSKNCPEVLPRGPEGQPLRVLTESYKQTEVNAPRKLRGAITKNLKDTTKKVTKLRSQLHLTSLGKGQTGVNPTSFVSIKETEDFKKVALHKSVEDKEFGDKIADIIPPSDGNATKYRAAAGMNEGLLSQLNVLTNGRLGNPLIASSQGATTHAFLSNAQTLHEYASEAKTEEKKQELLKKLSILDSQGFIFLQIASGNIDSHSKNIMVQNKQPIGIDFGRSLPADPTDAALLPRASYLSFPCLDVPVDPSLKHYFETLDIDSHMKQLRLISQEQYRSEYSDPDLAKLLDETLFQLQARLVMIQEGMKQGLNQRQLLALIYPPLSESEIEKVFSEDDPFKRRKELAKILKNKGFYKAWSDSHNKKDIGLFRKKISSEIKKIKNYKGELYSTQIKRAYIGTKLDIKF